MNLHGGYCIRTLYQKKSGDLQWQILHCALPTKVFLFKCKYAPSPLCTLCDELDTVFHVFCECCKLSPLFNLLYTMFRSLGIIFLKTGFIYGGRYSRHRQEICTYSNFLVGQAKLAIWKADKMGSEGKEVNMVKLFKALVESRIRLKYEFYQMNGDLPMFEKKWCVNKGVTYKRRESLFQLVMVVKTMCSVC